MARDLRTGLSVLSLLASLMNSARADEPQAPVPNTTVGVSATAWLASGRFGALANTSPGLRPRVDYRLNRWASLSATLDYVFLDSTGGYGDSSYFVLSAGPRLNVPDLGPFEPFVEILLGYHHFTNEIGGESDVTPRLSAGLSHWGPGDVLLTAGIGHTSASADLGDGGEFSFSIVVVEAGIGFRF